MNTQLTRNFFLSEFLKSQRATRMGRKIEAPKEVVENLRRLCETALQPIRDGISTQKKRDVVTVITSGFRPKWLNELEKGSPTSYHMDGLAADFEMAGVSNYDICKWIEENISWLHIDKVIYEFGDWVHVQVAKDGKVPRRQVLTATHDAKTKKVVYLSGIIKQEEN